jgi:hypothetical protein
MIHMPLTMPTTRLVSTAYTALAVLIREHLIELLNGQVVSTESADPTLLIT